MIRAIRKTADRKQPVLRTNVYDVHRHEGEMHLTVALSYDLWLRLAAEYGLEQGIGPTDVEGEEALCDHIAEAFIAAWAAGVDAYLFGKVD